MKTVSSFESVTLRENGMRGSWEYEILPKGEGAQVSRYDYRYTEGQECRVLIRQAVCGADRILRLLNGCAVLSWNGFHGAHPRGVLDGIAFSFSALLNGDTPVKAEGSQNFPRRYREFTDGLYQILQEGEAFD